MIGGALWKSASLNFAKRHWGMRSATKRHGTTVRNGHHADALLVRLRDDEPVPIQLEVYAENGRARKVYERVGFTVEGVRREAMSEYGRYQEIVTMGLLGGELIHA